MGLYREAPINTIPIIPIIIGDIPNSSLPVSKSIAVITIITIPIQNIGLFGFLVACSIFSHSTKKPLLLRGGKP